MELVILVGLPGAGKSSFYRARFPTYRLISKDLMKNRKNRDLRQQLLLREALERGENVVVDNTNPSRRARAPLIAMGREFSARMVAYHFLTGIRECLERNMGPNRIQVPAVAIYAAAKQMEIPTPEEGFDAIYQVRTRDHEFRLTRVHPTLDRADLRPTA